MLKLDGVTVLVAFENGGSRAPVGVRISGPDGQWAQWGDMNPVERVVFKPPQPKKRRKTRSR